MAVFALHVTITELQALFLCSLFLYPFSAAAHTLYMIPQLLLLGLGLLLLPRSAPALSASMKVGMCALAIVSSSTAMIREIIADQADFLEPAKLLINLSTLVMLLFLVPVFDPANCAKWLKRFAASWLIVVIGAYLYAGTSAWEMVLLLLQPEGLTSAHLYEAAEPLTQIFLTKNIVAMYAVAIFGAFLYFRRRSGLPVTVSEKASFVVLVVLLFSRQGILAVTLVLALDYILGRKGKLKRWSLVALGITALVVGSFVALAFDFNSPNDGAATRLDLWHAFFAHWTNFVFSGLGVHALNASLEHLDIDNYHMFFMNQIAAYGLIHTVAFNLLLTIIALRALPKRTCWLLIAPYWLNVAFQTYGYEYGNLFLFCIAANSSNLQSPHPLQALVPHGEPLPHPIPA